VILAVFLSTLEPQDPSVPAKWLGELFDKYVPECILEMRRSYSHITPLGAL
jgi:dynein heavy chain